MLLLKRTATSFAWNHLGRVCEYAFVYFFSVIVARKLGAEVNGTYAMLLSVVQVLLIVSSLGLETSVASSFPRLLQKTPKDQIAGTFRGLLVTRLIGVAVISLAFLLARNTIVRLLNAPPFFIDIFSVLIFYFSLRSVVSLLTSFHIARLDVRGVTTVTVGMRGLEVIGAAYLLSMGYGLREIFFLITLTALGQVLGLSLLLKDYFSGTFVTPAFRSIISTGRKFWINGLLEFILGKQADIILLSYFLIAPRVIGHYDVALSFAQLINFGMTTGLYGISIASFASLAGSNEKLLPQYWEFLSRGILFAVVPVFVFAAGFAGTLLPAIYSADYLPSVILFQIFTVFFIVTRLLGGGIAADYFQASGKTGILLTASGVSGGVNLVLAFLLIPKFGALGASYATGIAALVIAGIHGFYSWKILNVNFPLKAGFTIIGSSLLSAALVKLFAATIVGDNLVVLFLLYSGIFLLVCYVIKPLTVEDANFLRSVSETLYNFMKVFVSFGKEPPHSDDVLKRLTDRQKWAFSWMPQSVVAIDVGSSSSPLSSALAHKALYAYAVDVDRTALRVLKENRSSVQPIEASASRLPFPSGSVDTVLLLDILEHVTDERKVITEMQRVLRPGGTLILSVPYKGLFRFLDPQNIRLGLTETPTPLTIHRHYSDDDLTRLLFLRFRIIRKHYGGLFLYPLSFAANNFVQRHLHRDWNRFFKRLGDFDNDISWGGLSYNLIVLAEKI